MRGIRTKLVTLALVLTASVGWASAPAGRYTPATDTVKDNMTGLSWQRALSPQSFKWDEAMSYCQALNLGGTLGWRLPTKKELETLVDRRAASPAIDSSAFPDTPSAFFWTSTPVAGLTGFAWYIYFGYGFSFDGNTTYA